MTNSKDTDSKAGKETDICMDMRTTEYDWYRLSELFKTGVDIYNIVIRYNPTIIDQHVVGKEDDCRSNKKAKKDSKKVEKVIYAAGKESTLSASDFVQDFGLIKCLSSTYKIHNPFLWIPSLDCTEIPIQRTFYFNSVPRTFDFNGGSVNTKSKRSWERKAKACYMSMVQKELRASTKFKITDEQLRATVRLLNKGEGSDSSKKVKPTDKFNSNEKSRTTEKSDVKLGSTTADVPDSRKNAKATKKSDSGKKAKATWYSNAKIESKTTGGSESRKKAKAAEKSDPRKRANKAREKFSAKHELKATEREIRSGADVMMVESEVGKGADNQKEKPSSRPCSKSVRTCMKCGLQEPAPKMFKKCRRCKDEGCPDPPYYCGRDCQVLDWTTRHRQQHEKNYMYAGDPATS